MRAAFMEKEKQMQRLRKYKLAEKNKLILSLEKELQKERQKREDYHDKYLKQVKEAYLDDPDHRPTGRIIRKQLIKVSFNTEVIEY